MFERPRGGDRAILVHVDFRSDDEQEELEEFRLLSGSAGADMVATLTAARHSPDPRFFIGSGKADQLRELVEAHEADVVLFNHALNPGQERNLEQHLQCRVLDRTGLILDIFAQRAHSFEGKLQVELAQLTHLSTRLVRGWSHLERQKGGIGLRGPGEKQLETDRRLLGHRIKQINRRLEKVRRQRDLRRKARRKADLPLVSLVGYTNAGKSTLFNRLTKSEVYAADQLFATLDPTVRRVNLNPNQPVILTDTVGFIRHLPHDLVAAFRATLEEIRESDLILHVIDAAAEERDSHSEQVRQVLEEIDALEVPQIQVYNKIDSLEGVEPRLDVDEHGLPMRVWLSALAGQGFDQLRQAIAVFVDADQAHGWLRLPPAAGRLRARLFQQDAVRGERLTEQGEWLLEVCLQRRELERLCTEEGYQELELGPVSVAGTAQGQ